LDAEHDAFPSENNPYEFVTNDSIGKTDALGLRPAASGCTRNTVNAIEYEDDQRIWGVREEASYDQTKRCCACKVIDKIITKKWVCTHAREKQPDGSYREGVGWYHDGKAEPTAREVVVVNRSWNDIELIEQCSRLCRGTRLGYIDEQTRKGH
jgi:hypothetical protein